MTRAAATFTVASSARSGECVVKAEGEIDVATAPEFRDVLTAEINAAPTRLIIDMAGVSLMDSSGLSALSDAYKQGAAGRDAKWSCGHRVSAFGLSLV